MVYEVVKLRSCINFSRFFGDYMASVLARISCEDDCDGGALELSVGVAESEQQMPRAIVIDNCAA